MLSPNFFAVQLAEKKFAFQAPLARGESASGLFVPCLNMGRYCSNAI